MCGSIMSFLRNTRENLIDNDFITKDKEYSLWLYSFFVVEKCLAKNLTVKGNGKMENEKMSKKVMEPVEESKGTERKNWLPIVLIICGVVGIVTLFICSTQIETIEMKPLVQSDEMEISTDYTISDIELYVPQRVHSFFPFLRYYNLNIIAGGFAVMFVVGILWLVHNKRRSEAYSK